MSGISIRVFVLTRRRPGFLHNCLKTLLDSDLIQVDYTIYIINNHTELILSPDIRANKHVRIINNMTRADFSTGHVARDWNTALIFGFEKLDKPACPIVCTIQDDSEVYPNWCSELLSIMPSKYDFVSAGAGDQFCAYTPRAVQTIGIWDERFCNTGYQDADYYLRARYILDDRASINDVTHDRVFNPSGINIIVPMLTGSQRNDTLEPSMGVFNYVSCQVFYKKWPMYTDGNWSKWSANLPFKPDGELDHLVLYPYFII